MRKLRAASSNYRGTPIVPLQDHVWKLHGLPTRTISDRGPQFTAEVYRLLGIKAAKTTAYHPQADGQTKRVNQELEQYLRLFVGERQDNQLTSLLTR